MAVSIWSTVSIFCAWETARPLNVKNKLKSRIISLQHFNVKTRLNKSYQNRFSTTRNKNQQKRPHPAVSSHFAAVRWPDFSLGPWSLQKMGEIDLPRKWSQICEETHECLWFSIGSCLYMSSKKWIKFFHLRHHWTKSWVEQPVGGRPHKDPSCRSQFLHDLCHHYIIDLAFIVWIHPKPALTIPFLCSAIMLNAKNSH